MRLLNALLCATALLPTPVFGAESEEQQKINGAVEALTRLEGVNLEEKPAIKAAVERVLEKTRGTENFVKLVGHFRLTNQNPGLIDVAARLPSSDAGVEAVRLVLRSGDVNGLKAQLGTTNGSALIEALGHAKDRQTAPWLTAVIVDEKAPLENRRAAVRALVQTQEGAKALLTLAEGGRLPEDLKFTASAQLASVRWPEIKAQAAKALPPPAGRNAEPLPPMAELIKRTGNATKGAEIFRRDTAGCIRCHQVRGEGGEVGPGLSEIGTKLPKEALYEALLEPSAGISFGYEAWQVQLKSGDEAYGIKASDTPEMVAIKDPGGIITRYPRKDIASMQQMKTSIMPSGLQEALTTAELVDLIEYLASLRKSNQ